MLDRLRVLCGVIEGGWRGSGEDDSRMIGLRAAMSVDRADQQHLQQFRTCKDTLGAETRRMACWRCGVVAWDAVEARGLVTSRLQRHLPEWD